MNVWMNDYEQGIQREILARWSISVGLQEQNITVLLQC